MNYINEVSVVAKPCNNIKYKNGCKYWWINTKSLLIYNISAQKIVIKDIQEYSEHHRLTWTRIILTRIVIDMSDAAATTDDFRSQTRSSPGTSRKSSEVRASFLFIAQQAVIQSTSWSRSIIWFLEIFHANCTTCLTIIDSVVIPYLGAFSCQSNVHVTLQTSLFIKQSNRSTLLSSGSKIFNYSKLQEE